MIQAKPPSPADNCVILMENIEKNTKIYNVAVMNLSRLFNVFFSGEFNSNIINELRRLGWMGFFYIIKIPSSKKDDPAED